MKKKVPCDEAEMRSAIISILSERENETDGHGQSLSAYELQSELEIRDFEFSGEELGNVLNKLNLNGKITVALKAKGAEEELLVFVDLIYLSPSKKEKTSYVNCAADLIQMIGDGVDSRVESLVAARVRLWDQRIVTGRYYGGEKTPDLITVQGVIPSSDKILQDLVLNKLLKGKYFIVQTGMDDQICTIEWSISEK